MADAATFTTGQKLVTNAATRVQLVTSEAMLSEGVYLRALSTNTGKIYWGGATVSSSTGIELAVNESVFIPCKYASAIWLDASVSGEGVRYALI